MVVSFEVNFVVRFKIIVVRFTFSQVDLWNQDARCYLKWNGFNIQQWNHIRYGRYNPTSSQHHTAPNQKRVTGYYITSMLLMDEDGLLLRSTLWGYRSIAGSE